VQRTVVPSTPVRIDYALTDKGLALNEVIVAVSDWAEHWLAPVDVPAAAGDG
jgi:DNA-binding HxlR family transcriptional regulator